MFNLIKAEVYKYLKRPFTYITTLILSIGTFLVVALVSGKFTETPWYTREKFLSLTFAYFPIILIFMMIFGGIISEEYKERTFKNLCASNISKSKIFFSKFIVQIFLAIVIATICMIVFLVSVNMLKPGEGYTGEMLKGFTFRFIASTPIFLAGIALVNLLVVIFKKDLIVCIVYYFIMQLGTVTFILLLCETLFSSNMTSRVFVISKACPAGMNFALILIILFSLVFSEEYKYNSLKNLIISNVSKEKIYLGKLLVQIVIILFIGVILIGVFISGFLLLKPGDGYSNDILIRFLIKMIASLPLLLSGLALSNLLIIGIKKEGIAIIIYIMTLLLSSDIIKLLSRTIWDKLSIINEYFFNTQILILNAPDVTNGEIIQAAFVGIVSFIVFTTLGGLFFKRAEVK